MSQFQNNNDNKIEEVSVIDIPNKNPRFAKTGLEAVIYYYDDPQHKWPPKLLVREYYPDKANGNKLTTRGLKIYPEHLPDLISVLTKIHERYEERKAEGGK